MFAEVCADDCGIRLHCLKRSPLVFVRSSRRDRHSRVYLILSPSACIIFAATHEHSRTRNATQFNTQSDVVVVGSIEI